MEYVQIKRVYEPPQKADGCRVLVDRIWPRGLSKHDARIDLWMKDIAPSTELRKWFNHDPARWKTFQERYRAELRQLSEKLNELRARAQKERITLVYGAKDTEHNQALVLQNVLMGRKSAH
ncbi:hypothetical protein HYPDE_32393 [Hyphomicrobium denitrificans 1NES1]|uniref:Uroporphyrin-III C-methyltransferase n=1 Tax=Hyphomicrobium denitrificans 1NES1 TaxID=670307 RepID=N0B7C0_9HYPH|nr:DUF488 domain-containing protein [Hyphomicrobium denitrificans]AGK58152.1 hypothetical protein HYPDE_32393 [Hyphomicrobium denitrificans 1NES1]